MTRKFPVVCLLLFATVVARKPDKLLLVDELRYEFAQLEESLWGTVREAAGSEYISDKELLSDVKLLKEFQKFGDRIHKVYRIISPKVHFWMYGEDTFRRKLVTVCLLFQAVPERSN